MKVLLVGGSGRLGTELQKHFKFAYTPTRTEMDITDIDQVRRYQIGKEVDLIFHAAAITDVWDAENRKENCYRVNVVGTKNLASLGIPILYMSTDYIFDGEQGNYSEQDLPNPKNYYSLTKLLGEHQLNNKSKVVRSTFRPYPFPYEKAFIDQWTSADYIPVIAEEIAKAITLFENLPRVIHIGTERKTMYELASRSRTVQPCSRLDMNSPHKDVSLNSSTWRRLKAQNGV